VDEGMRPGPRLVQQKVSRPEISDAEVSNEGQP
jgi:hypothetical protein